MFERNPSSFFTMPIIREGGGGGGHTFTRQTQGKAPLGNYFKSTTIANRNDMTISVFGKQFAST